MLFGILGVTALVAGAIVLLAMARAPRIRAERESELAAGFANPSPAALGMRLPQQVASFYEQNDCAKLRNLQLVPPSEFADPIDEWHIQSFLPLHPVSLKNFSRKFPNCFPFAIDESGNCFYVRCDSANNDPPVRYENADAGVDMEIAPSFSAFLGWRRSE